MTRYEGRASDWYRAELERVEAELRKVEERVTELETAIEIAARDDCGPVTTKRILRSVATSTRKPTECAGVSPLDGAEYRGQQPEEEVQ
jgi:hypothetical protein